MHFIYVLDKESKNKMEQLGYKLIRSDATETIWVFANRENYTFDNASDIEEAGVSFILSDTLTF